MTVEERQKRTVLTIADKIERQAECLEGYAKQNGFDDKPIPSVFHLQASHFRTYANEIREVLGVKN